MSEGTKFKNGNSPSPLFDEFVATLPPYGDPRKAEIAALREQLATVKKERDTFKASYLEQVDLHNKTLDELASTEALCQQYREAMKEAIEVVGQMLSDNFGRNCESDYNRCYSAVYRTLDPVLLTPNPTAALNKYVAEELRRMADEADCQCALMLNDRADELEEK